MDDCKSQVTTIITALRLPVDDVIGCDDNDFCEFDKADFCEFGKAGSERGST